MARASTMNFSEAVAISASSLWAHKLRSVLTLIGVVIGVAAVIAVVSLINGANQHVSTRVFRLGADVCGLSKHPSIVTIVDDGLEFQKRKRITYDDFEAVRGLCKSCKEIGASLGGRVEVKSGLNSLKDTNLRAWTPQMAQLYDVDLVAGRHITDEDLRGAAPVCVIGNDLIVNLMPGVDPIGREIRWTTGLSFPSPPITRTTGRSRIRSASHRAPVPRRRFKTAWMKSARSCADGITLPMASWTISRLRPATPFWRCGKTSAALFSLL